MIKEISNQADWNNFILKASPRTFLQSYQWGRVQKAISEDVFYLGVFKYDKQVGAALVILVNARRGRHYLIPHGPLFLHKKNFFSCLPEIIKYLRARAKRDKAVAIRVAPLLSSNSFNINGFKQLGFHPAPLHVHAELTWVLGLDKSEDQLLKGMRKTTRHAIHKAQAAGVDCEIVTNPEHALSRFWPLYEQTRSRHNFVLWPPDMLKAQLEIFNRSNNIYSVFARYQNKDVAAAIIPIFGNTAFYYHGASAKLPSSVPATQLLQWTAIQQAKRRGACLYNFWGIAPADQPSHPFAGITTFKKGFGGRTVDYLHAQDLPLSLGYWKLWLVDTYRKHRRGF